MNLVLFAHNWNNGMLEQWNNGKNQYSNIPPFHYPIWPTWNMFHIKILLFQQVIEIPIHIINVCVHRFRLPVLCSNIFRASVMWYYLVSQLECSRIALYFGTRW